jgi:hypothetical protein
MIGDDEADVSGAMAAGSMGVLVQTVKYRPGQETRLTKPLTLVAQELEVVVDRLLRFGVSALDENGQVEETKVQGRCIRAPQLLDR